MGCESSILLYTGTKTTQLNANIQQYISNDTYDAEPTTTPLGQTNSNNSFCDKVINKLNDRTDQMQFIFDKISKYNKQIETEYNNILSATNELAHTQMQWHEQTQENKEYAINNHSNIINCNFNYDIINSCSDSEEPQIIFDSNQKAINFIDI